MRKILIVGTGLMAKEYFKALSQFDFEVTIVGRGELNAQRFYEEYNVKPFVGGVREYFLQNKVRFEFAIIAVGVDQLTEASIVCIENGCGKLLVEKPGGLNFDEIRNLAKTAAINNSEIYIAYNRRFYSSVMEAIRIADSDGGILSGSFEFTEWSHVIRELPVSDVIKSNYFLANSSHVFDLAFYIFGMPLRMNSYSGGDVGWHRPAIYSGAGVTESGVLFSYSANWESAGRWGVEILTKNRKLILRPMEKLFQQKTGELDIHEIVINNCQVDIDFKPGLYLQIKAFTSNSSNVGLKTLHSHIADLDWMKVILNGGAYSKN